MAYGVWETTTLDILDAFTDKTIASVMILLWVVIAILLCPIEEGRYCEKSTGYDLNYAIECMTISIIKKFQGYIGRNGIDIIHVRKLHSLVYAQSLHPV